MKAQHGGARRPRLSRVDPQAFAIGQRIRARRMALGLTQAKLSERCGLSQGCINHVESAAYKSLPNGATLAALATALGTTIDYLWFGTHP